MTTLNLTNPAHLIGKSILEYTAPKDSVRSLGRGRDSCPDETLVRSAKEGDLDAFDEIVARYQDLVWSRLFRFCPRRSELEDLVQRAFIKIFENLHRWRPNGSFKGWMMRVAVNTAYDYIRSQKNEPVWVAQSLESDSAEDLAGALVETMEQESEHPNAELIELLLMKLDPEDRLVITLQYYQEYSLSEIATQMGWSVSNAKIKSFRARKKLGEILARSGIVGI